MTPVCLLAAFAASGCLYLATPHQRFIPRARARARTLRVIAAALCVVSIYAGAREYGVWPGFFTSLTAIMLGCVALPYLDAWRHASHRASHVE